MQDINLILAVYYSQMISQTWSNYPNGSEINELMKVSKSYEIRKLCKYLDRTLIAKKVQKMLHDFMILRNEKSRKPDGSTIVAIPNMKLYEVDLEFTLRNKQHMMIALRTSEKWGISHILTCFSR